MKNRLDFKCLDLPQKWKVQTLFLKDLFTNEIIKHYGENFKIVAFNNLQLKIKAEGEGNKNGVKIY